MQIGMIGLGKMGANMVSRLRAGGHRCVVVDLDTERIQTLTAVGAEPATSIADLVGQLEPFPCGVGDGPSGAPTEETVLELARVPGRASRSGFIMLPAIFRIRLLIKSCKRCSRKSSNNNKRPGIIFFTSRRILNISTTSSSI